jgi:hypothetical protein
MAAPDVIKQLIERFDQHRDAYRAGKYNETRLRNEFLNPFFDMMSTQNPQETDHLTREIESVDRSIDGLVYELYGLSEEEIRIVEDA